MRLARHLTVLCLIVLGVGAPMALAAPGSPDTVPATSRDVPVASPELQAAMVEGVARIVPAEVVRQTPLQFVPLDRNLYLVRHPALYWRVEQEPAAEAMAEELATITPGWSTILHNGPYGRGVYLTYRRDL
jgi:hypothetical protein